MFVGPFILIAALTGLLYTATPQLEQLVHSRELSVPVGTSSVPLAQQVDIARSAVPNGTLIEVRPPRTETGTTRVTFSSPDVDEDHARTAFIDPHTGELRGVLTTFGEWLPVRSWFDTLHRTLMLGSVGRVYSELAASWLWVLAVSGLAIWLGRARRKRRLRRTLLPQTTGRGRGRLLTWYGSVGLWAAIGLLFLSATGLTWSQFAGANFSTLRAQFDWSTPAPTATLPPTSAAITVTPDQLGTTVSRVLDAARAAGLNGPVAVNPGEAGEAWTAAQVQRSWPVQQDVVSVDPANGQVLDRVNFADWPMAGKLAEWGVDAHMGLLFGVVNQLFLAALALGLICMIVWAYRMWWLRRPRREDASGRYARPLAAIQPTGPVAIGAVAVVAIVTGLAFPVMGA